MKPIQAADLFCGAGGTTTGLLRAAESLGRQVNMLAVNHWNLAIETHTLNHPGVRHLCESLQNVNPRQAIPGGRLDLLCASPECTHHSRARGGRPRSDQSRAGAFFVVDWCAALRIENIIIENVPEFAEWGPLTTKGKPNKRKKGRIFQSWLAALESLGYHLEWRRLVCADYGDPTTRERLFVIGSLGRKPEWPTPSHANRWRAAREIIDWSLEGNSIFTRKKPLSKNTLRRIFAGLEKFSGLPYLVELRGTSDSQIRATAKSLDNPIPTLTTSGGHMGLIQPFLVHTCHAGGDRVHDIESPIPTITAGHRGEMALCQPMIIGQQSCAAARPVSDPLPTVAGAGAIALAEPFLVKYYATGGARPISEPLDTITTKPRFGLCQPVVKVDGEDYLLDIKFRMLQPHELAAGQGFPKGYLFAGNREATVKQIGNAVPVNTATALCRSMLQNQ